jgi:hypothetical protein
MEKMMSILEKIFKYLFPNWGRPSLDGEKIKEVFVSLQEDNIIQLHFFRAISGDWVLYLRSDGGVLYGQWIRQNNHWEECYDDYEFSYVTAKEGWGRYGSDLEKIFSLTSTTPEEAYEELKKKIIAVGKTDAEREMAMQCEGKKTIRLKFGRWADKADADDIASAINALS